jgi:hypothetical protein
MNATNPDTCRFWRNVLGIHHCYRLGVTTEADAIAALRPHFSACSDEEIKTFLHCDVEGEKAKTFLNA